MAEKTSITVSEEQKKPLIQFKAELEQKRGEDLSQGEAVRIAAEKAYEWESRGSDLL